MASSKKGLFLVKIAAQFRRLIFQIFLFGSRRSILSSCDIKWPTYDIILNIQYVKGHIKNRYKITHLLNLLYRIFYYGHLAWLPQCLLAWPPHVLLPAFLAALLHAILLTALLIAAPRKIGKLSRNLARKDFGLNLSFMVSPLYLSDLLIGVGLVTGVTFTTHLSNANFIVLFDPFVKNLFLFRPTTFSE